MHIVQSMVIAVLVVCLSIALIYNGHVRWITWKLMSQRISLTCLLPRLWHRLYSFMGASPHFGWNRGDCFQQ